MSIRKSPRLLGLSVPQDKGPLKGKPRKETTRKRKAFTPAADFIDTPDRRVFDPLFVVIMRSWRGPRLGSRARQNQGCNPGVDQGAPGCSTGVLIPACQQDTLP
jgi:hypothetical protein